MASTAVVAGESAGSAKVAIVSRMRWRGLRGRVDFALGDTFAGVERFLENERRQLPLWMPVALGLGIVAWFMLPREAQWLGSGAGALAVALLGIALPGWTGRVLLVGGLLAAVGLGVSWTRADSVAAPRLDREIHAVWIDATVTEREDRAGRGQWRLYLEPHDPALPPLIRVSFRKPPAPGIAAGAKVRAWVSLRPPPAPSVPGGYDFARRAWFEGVGATGYALGDPVLVAPAPPASGAEEWLEAVRVHLTKMLQAQMGGAEGGLSAAFVTGDVGGVPEQVRQDMTDAGLAHIIAISGLNISIVVIITMFLVRRTLALIPWIALRWPIKLVAAGTAAFMAVAYTLVAGAQVPAVRAAAAALIVLAGLSVGRAAISLRTIAVGAFVIMLFRPEALLGPSFQLTFAAVTSLVAAFQSRPGKWLTRAHDGDLWITRTTRHAVVLIASGCVAEAALAPIALYHFNREGVYGMIANLVAIPWSDLVIMPLLMLTLAMDAIGWAVPAAWALRQSMTCLIWVSHFVAHWPGAVLRVPTMPFAAYAGFVVGGLWLCLWGGRARLLGLGPIVVSVVLSATARPPDLIISGDGRHLGVLRADGAMAMLRPHAGEFIRSMWGDSLGTARTLVLDEVGNASCGPDACVLLLRRGGREWRVFATRSKRIIPRPDMEAQCRAADVVVSECRLPVWCAPQWERFDARALERTGSVAVWLADTRVDAARTGQGAHPWAAQVPVWRGVRRHDCAKNPTHDLGGVPPRVRGCAGQMGTGPRRTAPDGRGLVPARTGGA